MTSILRIVRAGVIAAVAAGATGWGVERARFGRTDQDALARVERELRDRVDETARGLGTIAARVTASATDVQAATRDPAAARELFDETAAALRDQEAGRTGITVYGADGTPVAWAGRAFDLPKERLAGPPTQFVAPGALGPRLVRVDHVRTPPGTPRAGTIVVEQSLAPVQPAAGVPDTFVLETSVAPVRLRARVAGPPTAPAFGPFTFQVPSGDGGVVLEAEVLPADLAAARERWRAGTAAVVVSLLGLALLLCAGPILELRGGTRRTRDFLTFTIVLASLVLVSLALFTFAVRTALGALTVTSPPLLALLALAALALVAMGVDLVERRRVSRPRPRVRASPAARLTTALLYLAAGAGMTALLATYQQTVLRPVANTSLDVLHFSLHPLSADRLAVAFGLVVFHAAAIWAAVAVLRGVGASTRVGSAWKARAVIVAAWIAGVALAALVIRRGWPDVLIGPLLTAVAAAGGCALALSRLAPRLRHLSQATRLGVFFLALTAPAIALYPSLFALAIDAKERLVAEVYGPEALNQREELQRRLQQAIEQIDALPSLAEFVVGRDDSTPTTDRAFVVWSRTDLATYRLTSAVELYGADGRLVSRFALVMPDYTTIGYRANSCTWEQLIDEVSPFGSSERHVLRTGRGICERGRIVGSVVVRVMLDYRTLPFISSQSPYLASLQPERQPPPEGVSGRDIEFAVYGWSRAPLMSPGTTVWTLPDPEFDRLVASREPFWALVERDGERFRVYFLSDRGEIYALGFPVITALGHAINVAELVLLAGVLYVLMLAAGSLFGAITGRVPATGRGLLREVRSSFYRKLFLAYVAGAVVPVVVLAFAIRTYFATQLRAGAQETAQRTVTTAQRLVEDYAAIQQAGSTALSTLDDQIMVLVRRAVDEDVNLFNRDRLLATSARDLFASSLLPTRTPGDVYRHIMLDRMPTFVGDEEVGDAQYRLAAAPVRAGGREGIVTVPLTTRVFEIEEQIDELDRRVRAASVLFILLGAAIGYWMAERIADPVNRLTRATRRIARGDLDARIAATSSDELRRLVEDFNQMAADLKRQRTELERTQRLEAWAEMARQVAHDIKNPLTPIQLSAEHALRVNADRGRPLSPVLDECVSAILTQVKLLRQISAEFSSFASSPTPRPEPTQIPALVDEVVEPYRTGLAGRVAIEVHALSAATPAMIDRTLFSRALTNVIENALHAMPGGGRLSITMREDGAASPDAVAGGSAQPGSNEHHMLLVEIADTGVGMDQDALEKIFEPYFSTKTTGTGLGLTIAKRNVELLGGTIAVRSQRDVGTTVTISVPLATPLG